MGIEIRNAFKSYKSVKVLDGLSLSFPDSGTVCLFGPSGCGKSTLLNCIAGLETLDAGWISGAENLRISYLFQEDRLLPWSTAAQNIAAVLPGRNRMPQALEWLRRVGLDGAQDQYPCQLSGGMRRRVAIARALAFGGDLFLLDEPFQRLDSRSRRKIADLIEKTTAGKLKILVTHDREEADRLSEVICILSGIPLKILDKITNKD
ncbi:MULTISPECIES: ABC transporter ATP-binding protein [Acutalibacteraceae]|uniref:ABC transporter ATP-binding protein n=1 Tax=Acutalibacteraceae TaxID=3082771 RepID=UPI0013E8A10A|nr:MULTISPECIES: ATP-binding cassette domain-containing protein [Acutalibacteraceae]